MTLFLMAEIKFYFELILPISIYPLEQLHFSYVQP